MTHRHVLAVFGRLKTLRAGWLAGALGLIVAGCGSDDPAAPNGTGGSGGSAGSGASAGSGGSAGSAGAPMGTGPCNAVLVENPPSTAMHVADCSAVDYDTDPPSGGRHYGDWAAFQSYDFPVPHGFLVHALEHGAVVFWYNCPDGCADEVADVQAFIDARPADVSCAGRGAERRAILTPSPTLGARWAASAWGFSLTADCFDAAVFEDFYADHYGRGPEDLCVAGVAFTADPCE